MTAILTSSILETTEFPRPIRVLPRFPDYWLWLLLRCVFFAASTYAGPRIPGVDASDKLVAAGTVLRILDVSIFQWGCKIFAALSLFGAAHSLKEQRFGSAVICIISGLLFALIPTFVENLFEIGGGNGIFN